MKFLVDAQLTRRLARQLAALGHEALHTLELPAGNRTPDTDLIQLARRDGCVVVSKDSDFFTSPRATSPTTSSRRSSAPMPPPSRMRSGITASSNSPAPAC